MSDFVFLIIETIIKAVLVVLVFSALAGYGKKMVLITHHGVSPQALDPRFKNDDLNASFISDLESYITTHLPQLNLIVHGHIHHRCSYKIGHIRVECNPCGYIDLREGWHKHSWNKDLKVEI
ncbi:hypothetical protein FACS1894103_6400 [Campylobacterota bacterium]|nr:hypothetical protein FACS1894103_6400 [Campylobacterota bacterium]